MSEKISPMFSSRNLMVLCLIFRSLNHFELTFVYGIQISWYSNFMIYI